jgi:hypothetical protein
MARPSNQRSAVLGTVKDKPPAAVAILDGACARRCANLRSGRRNVSRDRTKEWNLEKENEGFRGGLTPTFPKRGPDAGTMDQVRPHCATWHHTTRSVDWPAYPLQTPSGGGPCADPGQKQDPGERIPRKWRRGIDKPRPVTEGRNKRSALRRTQLWRRRAAFARSGAMRCAYCALPNVYVPRMRSSFTRAALPWERGTSPGALTTTAQVTPTIDLR